MKKNTTSDNDDPLFLDVLPELSPEFIERIRKERAKK